MNQKINVKPQAVFHACLRLRPLPDEATWHESLLATYDLCTIYKNQGTRPRVIGDLCKHVRGPTRVWYSV